MGNSDKQKKEKPFDLERMKNLFSILSRGASYPRQRGGSSHSGGHMPSPYAKQRRKDRLKAAKFARRSHRFG